MSIKTEQYARIPFEVDAIQVTDENLEDVAAWCQGDVRSTDNQRYVKVRVHRALTERQTQAFVGDWVLYAGTGFKVYTSKAFEKSFAPAGGSDLRVIHRDAKTGGFVTDAYAEANPDTTVTETQVIFGAPGLQ